MTVRGRLLLVMAGGVLLVAGQAAGAQAAAANPAIDAGVQAKANAGDAAAQVEVGESYAKAAGTDEEHAQIAEDWTQAAAWYKKAADQGDVSGELHLAVLYRDGGGEDFTRDMEQSAEWYEKAAEQGDVGAQGTLGMLYAMGLGVQQSDTDAYFWLDLAAGASGPKQQQYAMNRQNVGARITADEQAAVELRVKHWKAAHPRADADK